MQFDGLGYDIVGQGPPVVFLHGFPQCRAMWRDIVSILKLNWTCITVDLPGYGESDGGLTVEQASFRAMADRIFGLMAHLDVPQFHLIGHDRGGRVAHRMALDAPEKVISFTAMDIVPTYELVTHLRSDVVRAYYHWFFLAQPAPFPERLIQHDPDAYFDSCLAGWGGVGLQAFDPTLLDNYRQYWRKPDVIHAMCNDYRAALDIDVTHDALDLARRVQCPACILWGADGVMARTYDVAEVWSDRLVNMQAAAVPGGHFFPETHATETAKHLRAFLSTHAAPASRTMPC